MTQPDDHRTGERLAVTFGDFEFFPTRRQLVLAGNPVKLGTRALEILAVLIEKPGQMVAKDELISRVWPTTVVEDINLRVHVSALRRAIGDGQQGNRFIVNAAGRGYSFVAEIGYARESPEPAPVIAKSARAAHNLPTALTRMVGRTTEVMALTQLVGTQRLVTIVGTGGVGKTTTGLAVARNVVANFEAGVQMVDLATARDENSVIEAFAAALGFSVSKEYPFDNLISYLKHKDLLLLVDNCEQVLAEVAQIVERLLRASATVRILATSREPLHAEGEWPYRMAPLGVPEDDGLFITAIKARKYASIELFVERALTGEQAFELTDANAGIVAAICRGLDGLPLAIELAAAGVGRLGIRELAVRVHDQVSIRSSGRRTAASRHQTLIATFDWSYDLLTSLEKLAFQRLAAFNAAFSLESAAGLVAHAGVSHDDAVTAVMGLAEKSLIATDISGMSVRHRFLNTVRQYAFEKLKVSSDFITIYRWHAEQVLKLMRQAELGWESLDREEWIAAYGYAMDDVRGALDWAFSSQGDALLGVSLTSISVPFGLQLARLEEFRARVEHALHWFTSGGPPQPELEVRLRATLGLINANLQRQQPGADTESTNHSDAIDGIGSLKNRISPLLRRTIMQIESGEYQEALDTAIRMGLVAQKINDPLAELTANRVAAQAHHFAGNHGQARAYAERVLDDPAKSIPVAYVPVQTDRRVWMRIVLARISWMEGMTEQAEGIAAESVELALADSPFALCQALAFAACPIAIWNGSVAVARQHVDALLVETSRYRLDNWKAYGEWYERVLNADAVSVEAESGLSPISASSASISGLLLDTIQTMNPSITRAGPQPLGIVGWSAPERLRVHGDWILRQNAAEAGPHAKTVFERSLQLAENQRALSWALRAATSLYRIRLKGDSSQTDRKRLESLCSRFSEGSRTRDLRTAQSLLNDAA